jgi:hypothetical protein
MSTKQQREPLKNLRIAIAQHMEDAASLSQQLPEWEHNFYLTNAVAAWELVANEPLTGEKVTRMVETLFSPAADEDPISATIESTREASE